MDDNYSINILKRVGRDTFFYIPAKVIPTILSIAGVYIFTRLLKPAEYGQYVLVISFISFINIFFYNWLGASSFRYYEESKLKNELNIYGSTIFYLHFIVSVSLGILGILCYFIFNKYIIVADNLYWAALILLWLNSFFSINLNYIRASCQIFKYNIFVGLESFMKIAFAVGAIVVLSMKVEGIIWGYSFAYLLILLIILIHIFKVFNVSIKYLSAKLSKSFIYYGFPLVGASIFVWILSLADRYIIQLIKGSELVGIYAAGYQIAANVIQIPSSLLMMAAFPLIIQVYEDGNQEQTERLITRLISVYLLLCMPILLIIALFPDLIVEIFLGSGFGRASSALLLISLGQFCLGLSVFYHKGFELKKKTYSILIFLVISAFLNIVLNFILIPSMNEYGAALATFISYMVYLSLLWINGNKLLYWRFPYQTFIKCLLSAAICYGIILISRISGILKIYYVHSVIAMIFCLIIYIVILFFMKEKFVIEFINKIRYIIRKRSYK